MVMVNIIIIIARSICPHDYNDDDVHNHYELQRDKHFKSFQEDKVEREGVKGLRGDWAREGQPLLPLSHLEKPG